VHCRKKAEAWPAPATSGRLLPDTPIGCALAARSAVVHEVRVQVRSFML
jgi:hypothetical protein